MKKHLFIVLAELLCLSAICPANAHEIAAVLSSDSQYYVEAFNGFQNAIGYPVKSFTMQKAPVQISAATKVVVAFGGRASLLDYETAACIVSCMAPSVEINDNRYYYISMSPRPGLLLSKLKLIQPALKRLAVFWTSESMKDYLRQIQQEAALADITLTAVRLKNLNELPDHLRAMQGKTDAIFFPPDPLLVNAQTFETVRDFSAQNHIPFYAPTEALVEKGAVASVSSSFENMGRSAAFIVDRLFNGKTVKQITYSDEVRLAINLKAAGLAGLKITPEMLTNVDKVFP
ncbi:MAG: hypothetical protein A2X34_02080 [Elusimicrobia bacterium GWC2_51_8]|nr:MAG: hypothetical protein A2X33_07140 [Elusimicrobia bacterium GWA2_51_34]OGR60044.1 MAG: hypothetical protein A2X34_02080 [Elusimicrobia bacterium GWC2_51_8]HAF95325.1 hypothetical protein [Elusimicrobiota bacterium]HCE96903.1 hypothetical protein [Elusimicrobiota bacterium]